MSSATVIPSGSRKIVQNLREIVNCPEADIYAMLKECNMDPNEAVHRLLNQDTFHEVKSKREKKKETTDVPEYMPRSANNYQTRGGGRGGRTSSTQRTYNDYGSGYGKPVSKKEDGTNALGSTPSRSEAASIQNMPQSHKIVANDGPPLPSQSAGFQNNWSKPTASGQMSMADIVRLGKSQAKPSSTPAYTNPTRTSISQQITEQPPAYTNPTRTSISQQITEQHPAYTNPTRTSISQQNPEQPPILSSPPQSVDPVAHHEEKSQYNSHNDWPTHEEKSQYSSHSDWPTHEEISGVGPSSSSTLQVEEKSRFDQDSYLDDTLGNVYENSQTDSNRSESVYHEETEIGNSGDIVFQDDGPHSGMDSYHSLGQGFEPHEVDNANDKISPATANLQQLNLQEDVKTSSTENNPAVIIPSHLQVVDADFSLLSFGSFGSNMNNATTPSGSFPSKPLRESNLDMAPVPEETAVEQLNSRNTEYYDEDQLKSTLDENVTNTRSYDMPSVSEPEIRNETHDIQGNFPSGSDYTFPFTTQPTATYSYPDLNSQMRNLSPFSTLMQPYSNSMPGSLLVSNAQPREYELPSLQTTESMASQYNAGTPSISGPLSVSEVKPEGFSSPQLNQQNLPASNIHPSLTQHLSMHPYSQPSLPLGHFANMIGYPFMPQNYAYLPYAASNSTFLPSQAAAMKYNSMLPQYKSGISGSTLAQSSTLPPGYGGLTGSASNIPENFNSNPSTALGNTAAGFEDALRSQYKDVSHYLPVQHNDSSGVWLQGAGSRGVSAIPGNTFYGFQGQQVQQSTALPSYRQAPQQHPSQQYAQMAYLNLYQSQGGTAQDQQHHQQQQQHHQQQQQHLQQQQQQNPNEGNISGSQGQMWQHGY